jgi:hypothetical protein
VPLIHRLQPDVMSCSGRVRPSVGHNKGYHEGQAVWSHYCPVQRSTNFSGKTRRTMSNRRAFLLAGRSRHRSPHVSGPEGQSTDATKA